MLLQITSDNMDLTPSMKVLTQEKLQKLVHKITRIKDAEKAFRVVLNTAPLQQFSTKTEATIRGKVFFTEETHAVFETSVILCVEELERQINKWLDEKSHEKDWGKIREQKHFH